MKLSQFFSNYFTVRAEMLSAVGSLSQEQLDWTPPHHKNSIGKLLSHIADCEYFWIREIATREISGPDYDQFDSARTLADKLALLKEQEDVFAAFMDREEIDDWDSVFYDGTEAGEKFSKRWLVWHVVEHQARHRGQIFMLMSMQGLEVPDV